MKKLIKIFIFNIAILGGTLFAQTVNPCSINTPTCQRFTNQDIDYLNRSILATGSNTTSVNSLTLNAIKKGIDTVNQTIRNINSKIDTTTKVFIKSFFPLVTYSAANVAMIGATTVQSWSINLGSGYWQMTDYKLLDLGNNFAFNGTALIMNDTINLVDNVAPTYTSVRARKIIGAMVTGFQINLPFTTGRSIHMVSNTNAASSNNYGIFTGIIYIYYFAAGVQALSGQEIKTRILFKQIKN